MNVTTGIFFLSYHKDKAIGKLKSVLVIIDLILFRFVAWRLTLYDVPSLYRFFFSGLLDFLFDELCHCLTEEAYHGKTFKRRNYGV